MTPAPDDIYSLESWLREKALEAHNNAAKHHGFTKGLEYEAEEKTLNKVIEKIHSGRVSQRPHVQGKV
jgi:hypothetical protein